MYVCIKDSIRIPYVNIVANIKRISRTIEMCNFADKIRHLKTCYCNAVHSWLCSVINSECMYEGLLPSSVSFGNTNIEAYFKM